MMALTQRNFGKGLFLARKKKKEEKKKKYE
jgi:hypothetical protein